MEEVLAKNDLADGKNEQQREMIWSVPLSLIDDFPEHPFKVKDDEEMEKLKDSISLYGVLTPVVARRCENGRYELISGHRRKYACKVLGIEFMPAIVREMSREEAVIAMVDSNLQREHILPSEKAFAYHFVVRAQKLRHRLYLRFVRSSAYHGKYHLLLFFTKCISGSVFDSAFFPDDGASMMVASTMLPPCTIFPSDERISCTSAKSRSGIPCAFSSAGICRA